jgi:flagellar basal body-associated protein FliL
MSRRLIIIIVLVVLVAAGAAYKVAKPKHTVKENVNGTIYILPKGFTINLNGGQYATLTAAVLLPPSESIGITTPDNPPPTGFGPLTDEAIVRAIITDDVTDQPESALLTQKGRAKLESKILSDINAQTDIKVKAIYFTDIAVQ